MNFLNHMGFFIGLCPAFLQTLRSLAEAADGAQRRPLGRMWVARKDHWGSGHFQAARQNGRCVPTSNHSARIRANRRALAVCTPRRAGVGRLSGSYETCPATAARTASGLGRSESRICRMAATAASSISGSMG